MTAPADDPLVQLNVRIPASVKAAVQSRVDAKGMRLAKWVENACRFALSQHNATATTEGTTATPPHRRVRPQPTHGEGPNL